VKMVLEGGIREPGELVRRFLVVFHFSFSSFSALITLRRAQEPFLRLFLPCTFRILSRSLTTAQQLLKLIHLAVLASDPQSDLHCGEAKAKSWTTRTAALLREEWETIDGLSKEGIVAELQEVVERLKEENRVVFVRFPFLSSFRSFRADGGSSVSAILTVAAPRANMGSKSTRQSTFFFSLLLFLLFLLSALLLHLTSLSSHTDHPSRPLRSHNLFRLPPFPLPSRPETSLHAFTLFDGRSPRRVSFPGSAAELAD
jgi:hypothetical protein